MSTLQMSPTAQQQLGDNACEIVSALVNVSSVPWDLVIELLEADPSRANSDVWLHVCRATFPPLNLDALDRVLALVPREHFAYCVGLALEKVCCYQKTVDMADQFLALAQQHGFKIEDVHGETALDILNNALSCVTSPVLVQELVSTSVLATSVNFYNLALLKAAKYGRVDLIEQMLELDTARDREANNRVILFAEKFGSGNIDNENSYKIIELVMQARVEGKLPSSVPAACNVLAKIACRNGRVDWLEQTEAVSPNFCKKNDDLLCLAAQSGSIPTVEFVIANGVSMSTLAWKKGRILEAALDSGNFDLVDLLTGKGFNFDDVSDLYRSVIKYDDIDRFVEIRKRISAHDYHPLKGVLEGAIKFGKRKMVQHLVEVQQVKLTPDRFDSNALSFELYNEAVGAVTIYNPDEAGDIYKILSKNGMPTPLDNPKLGDIAYDAVLKETRSKSLSKILALKVLGPPRRTRFTKIIKRALDDENAEIITALAELEPRPHKWLFARLKFNATENAFITKALPSELQEYMVTHLVADELESTEPDD